MLNLREYNCWKENAVAYVEVLLGYSSETTEENDELREGKRLAIKLETEIICTFTIKKYEYRQRKYFWSLLFSSLDIWSKPRGSVVGC
jgi:hypothetical protein